MKRCGNTLKLIIHHLIPDYGSKMGNGSSCGFGRWAGEGYLTKVRATLQTGTVFSYLRRYGGRHMGVKYVSLRLCCVLLLLPCDQ
jgi:hypothetical protein